MKQNNCEICSRILPEEVPYCEISDCPHKLNKLVIQTVTVFASVDKNGNEGVMGALMPDHTFMPLVAADETRIAALYPIAVDISRRSRMPFKVLQFSNRSDITEQIKEKYHD